MVHNIANLHIMYNDENVAYFFLATIIFGQVFEMCCTDVLIVTFP